MMVVLTGLSLSHLHRPIPRRHPDLDLDLDLELDPPHSHDLESPELPETLS